MSDAFTFSSSSSDISEEDLRNSFSNLYNSSRGTQIIVNKIKERNYEDGTQTQIKIVDDIPNGDGAVTRVDPSTGNIIIEIEKDAFDGDYYRYNNGQDTNRMSLERYLAEELMHNYQRKTSGISIEDANNMTDQELLDLAKKWEKEAQDVANKIMNEIYGPDKEPPADIPEDPVNNPNTYYGAGETPLIRNPNPADPDITDTLNETTFLLPPWLSPHAGANANGGVVFGQAGDGSPLILDLNGDGVKSSNLWGADPSKTYFDMDNDGYAERTAWAAGGDGLLAFDRNGNGKIDNQSELFGESTGVADGFAALKKLDSNKDNKITSADADFAKLRVWVDADSDGVTDAGELKTLAELKITQINLNATAPADAYNNDNWVSGGSTFVMNGATRSVQDVWFRMDQADTRYTGDYTLDVRTLFLPTLRGFGTIKDLHVAMSGDETLLTLVQKFVTDWDLTRFANTESLDQDITKILNRWAGIDGVAADATLYGMNAQQFLFIEKFLGQKPNWWRADANPNDWGGLIINNTIEIYSNVYETLKSMLIYQAGGNALFDGGGYNLATGEIEAGVITQAGVDALQAAGNATVGIPGNNFWNHATEFVVNVKHLEEFTAAELSMIDKLDLSSYVGGGLLWHQYAENFNTPNFPYWLAGTDRTDFILGGRGGDFIDPGMGNDIVHGGFGGDTIRASEGDDQLYGDEGDDWIVDYYGNNVFVGGAGNDTLYGGRDNDTYIYDSGVDNITDSYGSDIIKFGAGITLSNIALQRNGGNDDLHILLNGKAAIDVLYNFQDGYGIEKIQFDDEISLDLTQFKNVVGTEANNTLNGLDKQLLLDDVIYGYGGNDTLNGKLGNDFLYGGEGNDRYIYFAGTGQGTDTILDSSGTADYISLGAGYTAANISLVRIGDYDMAIKSGNTTLILVKEQFINGHSIERLVYGDGTSLNLLTYSHTVNGTSGADYIYGTSYGAGGDILNGLNGDDYIYAGAGNDIVSGGSGNDYILGEDGNDILRGDAGNDTVFSGLGNDTVIYDSGYDIFQDAGGTDIISITNTAITAANMSLRRLPGNQGDLDVILNGVRSFTIQGQFYENQGFETIKFADGTTFDLRTVQYTTTGNNASEILYGIGFGGNTNDIIKGNGGNDTIYAFNGNDSITGGTGNDSIDGGAGNDTYYYNAGDGLDTLSDSGGADVIQLGAGFVKADLTGTRIDKDFHLYLKGVETFVISNHFTDGYGIETIKFADGTTSALTTWAFTVSGATSGDNYLYGTDNARDTINGLAGNDQLYGFSGNDILTGGTGQDGLYGGLGDDTYIFKAGESLSATPDYVGEAQNEGVDTIKITGGILPDAVRMWDDIYGNLYMQYTANDTVQIVGIRDYTTSAISSFIERITFDNGTIWDLRTGLNMTDTDEGHSLFGSVKNEILDGRGGDDSLSGNAGDDTLIGGLGMDTLHGGLGDDTYIFKIGESLTATPDYIYDEDGVDTIKLTGGILPSAVTISTNGWQMDIKYSSTDTIAIAGTYDYTISTFIPNIEKIAFDNGTVWDLRVNIPVNGTTAANIIQGSDLSETILADAGNDTVYAAGGNDILNGGAGNDRLEGGGGDDRYIYAAGGGQGLDTVYDSNGNDTIEFGAGYTAANISLVRSGDYDLLLKNGATTLIKIEGQFNGSNPIETIKWGDGTTTNLLTYRHTTNGISGDDSIYGVNSGAGGDKLNGLAGNDYLYGQDGNDTLTGGTGNDYLNGGTGNDTYVYNAGDGLDVISENEGTDIIQIGAGFLKTDLTFAQSGNDMNLFLNGVQVMTIQGHYLEGSTVETVQFADGSTTALTGFAKTVNGTSGSEGLEGTAATNDTLNGLGGNDYLYGYSGNDTLNGGTGTDNFYGGKGNDIYVFKAGESLTASGMDTIYEGYGEGTDTVKLTGGILPTAVTLTTDGAGGLDIHYTVNDTIHASGVYNYTSNTYEMTIEKISFDNGTVWDVTAGITLNGTSGSDYLYAYSGSDTLDGLDGDDVLYAGSGNDTLYGGNGNDTLSGEAGNDTLYGDAGTDYITGGLGADTFMFMKATAYGAVDQVYDFNKAEGDKINLADLLDLYDPATQAVTDFVRFTDDGTNTSVFVDANGGANSFVQVAMLYNVTGLTDEKALETAGTLVT